MERIVLSGQFTQNEMLKMNRLRVYLQVFFMSDITTVNGKKIKNAIYDVKRSNSYGTSDWEWPYQPLNSRIGLSLWRKVLVEICAETGTLDLQQPLGTWIRMPHTSPPWFLSSCKQKLYYAHSPTSCSIFLRTTVHLRLRLHTPLSIQTSWLRRTNQHEELANRITRHQCSFALYKLCKQSPGEGARKQR